MAPSFLRRCKKCGEEYHPIEQSAECPHEKIEPQPDEGLREEIGCIKIGWYDVDGGSHLEPLSEFPYVLNRILSKAQARCEKRIVEAYDKGYKLACEQLGAECDKRVREERERLIPIVCRTVCKFLVKSDEKIECGRPDCPLEFFLNKNVEALRKGEG